MKEVETGDSRRIRAKVILYEEIALHVLDLVPKLSTGRGST